MFKLQVNQHFGLNNLSYFHNFRIFIGLMKDLQHGAGLCMLGCTSLDSGRLRHKCISLPCYFMIHQTLSQCASVTS